MRAVSQQRFELRRSVDPLSATPYLISFARDGHLSPGRVWLDRIAQGSPRFEPTRQRMDVAEAQPGHSTTQQRCRQFVRVIAVHHLVVQR